MNAKTSTVMTDIYDVGDVRAERFLITGHKASCGKINYLDAEIEQHTEKEVPDEIHISGGASKTDSSSKQILYPSLNDMPDANIKEFLNVCHLDQITSNHKSNSIFIIPTSSAMDKIKEDISKALGSVDPKSPEAAIMIKTEPLLYKLFIVDSYGKEKDNAKFEYRIPAEYPEKFDSSIVYRRTTKYKQQVFFVKLEKSGISVSTSADMSDSVKCSYLCSVGKAPSYISFVFTGDVIPLVESSKSKSLKSKYGLLELYKDYIREEVDIDNASEKFVAVMIKNFGVPQCMPYYSANMLHSAIAMINAFGDKTECEDCDDYGYYHGEMMKCYTPKQRKTINSANVNKIINFTEDFAEHLADKTSASYFKAMKNGYMQIVPEVKDASFFENEIATDAAYAIYNETNNINLAIKTAREVKSSFTGTAMPNYKLRNLMSYLADQPLIGFTARQYYPMVSIKSETTPVVIKGGADDDDMNIEFDIVDDQ